MPEYEYLCPGCGYSDTSDDPAGMRCFYCHADMSRVYSAPAVLWPGGKPSAEGGDE